MTFTLFQILTWMGENGMTKSKVYTTLELVGAVTRIWRELEDLKPEFENVASSRFEIDRAIQALDSLKTDLQRKLKGG